MINRRRSLELPAASVALPPASDEESQQIITRAIPSRGERVPVTGRGTWITFDAGPSGHST